MNPAIARLQEAPAWTEQHRIPSPPRASVERLWLGVHFPQIALIATEVKAHQTTDIPRAVIEIQQQKSRIYQANDAARTHGLEKGMVLNAAYVLCRQLEVVSRDRPAELHRLKHYAQQLACFTPKIVFSGSDTLLLEVRDSLRLFGGLKALLTQLRQSLAGITSNIACAPFASSAELMARNGMQQQRLQRQQLQSALALLDIRQTAIHPALVRRLERCGLRSLGDLWRLPRIDLARRFSPDLLNYLDQLSGQAEAPSLYFEAGQKFSAGYDFEQETDAIGHLLHAAEVLLKPAQKFLRKRCLLSETIRFRFIYSHRLGAEQQGFVMAVHARQGGDCAADFLPQLNEQLQRLVFKKPVIRLELHIQQFTLYQDSTLDLFSGNQKPSEDWSVLLDILSARLGRNAVYRLQLYADHRPEKAWQRSNTGDKNKHFPLPDKLPQRPGWLLSQPHHTSIKPYTFIPGAERLESGWWQAEDSRREYYQAISASGQHCWLYRDLQQQPDQWYLHGLFA